MIYIQHSKILFSHKKEGNPAIHDNTHEPGGIMISEMSKTEKDKYCMVRLICGNLNKYI